PSPHNPARPHNGPAAGSSGRSRNARSKLPAYPECRSAGPERLRTALRLGRTPPPTSLPSLLPSARVRSRGSTESPGRSLESALTNCERGRAEQNRYRPTARGNPAVPRHRGGPARSRQTANLEWQDAQNRAESAGRPHCPSFGGGSLHTENPVLNGPS